MKLVKQDKLILKQPVSVIRKELSKNNYGFKYVQTENYRAYALITIESKLSQKDLSVILAKVDKEQFKVIVNYINDKTNIEIHNELINFKELEGTNNV